MPACVNRFKLKLITGVFVQRSKLKNKIKLLRLIIKLKSKLFGVKGAFFPLKHYPRKQYFIILKYLTWISVSLKHAEGFCSRESICNRVKPPLLFSQGKSKLVLDKHLSVKKKTTIFFNRFIHLPVKKRL